MPKENDNIKIILQMLYVVIGSIVTIISFIDFWARNDLLTTLLFGWIISFIKGLLWPIFIWFLI